MCNCDGKPTLRTAAGKSLRTANNMASAHAGSVSAGGALLGLITFGNLLECAEGTALLRDMSIVVSSVSGTTTAKKLALLFFSAEATVTSGSAFSFTSTVVNASKPLGIVNILAADFTAVGEGIAVHVKPSITLRNASTTLENKIFCVLLAGETIDWSGKSITITVNAEAD